MQNNSGTIFREIAMEVLRDGAELSFRAGGRSMSPFILDNEQVLIKPLTGALRIGDVILFEYNSRQLLLHRIVEIKKDGYITKGDANCSADETVPHGAVLGKAVHVVNGLNFHLRFPLGRLIAYLLSLRSQPMLFNIFRLPGRLLLSIVR